MSYAVLARKEAARAAGAKASLKTASQTASRAASGTAASGGLRIGDADDAFEREADRVADEVMAGGRTRPEWSLSRMSIESRLRRKCACGGSGECQECKQKKTLQRKTVGPAEAGVAPPIVHEVLNSPGQPLDREMRKFFGARFGYDFGRVRVHTDRRADESARSVNAQAYAVGREIVFASRMYQPFTSQGRRLLAHELTHIVQQNAGGVRRERLQRQEDNTAVREGASDSPAPAPPFNPRIPSPPVPGDRDVFVCSRHVKGAPIPVVHSFFRIGDPTPKAESSFSLFPQNRSKSDQNPCWQGDVEPDNDVDRRESDAECVPARIAESCLKSQSNSYPNGPYCSMGPNSNTYVGTITKNCNGTSPPNVLLAVGFDDDPPPAGTFATKGPDDTVFSCPTKTQCTGGQTQDSGQIPEVSN